MEIQKIRNRIEALLRKRGPGRSICPSEVARDLEPGDWRDLMEPVRDAARQMAREGALRITQGDEVLDPDQPLRGPVRLRKEEG